MELNNKSGLTRLFTRAVRRQGGVTERHIFFVAGSEPFPIAQMTSKTMSLAVRKGKNEMTSGRLE